MSQLLGQTECLRLLTQILLCASLLCADGRVSAASDAKAGANTKGNTASGAEVKAKGAAQGEVGRDDLRYEGKEFEYWRRKLKTDISPDVRVGSLRALGAFGRRGFGPESTAAVLDLIREYREVELAPIQA